MNERELLDAMQYIDEDLLAGAERVRRGQARRLTFRRFVPVAALAAASVLAVFTLRFVSGKGLHGFGGMGASGAPAAAVATEEAAVVTEEAAAEAAPAEAAADAAPAEAAAEYAIEETEEAAVEEAAVEEAAADMEAPAAGAAAITAVQEAAETEEAAVAPAEAMMASAKAANERAENDAADMTAAATAEGAAAEEEAAPMTEMKQAADAGAMSVADIGAFLDAVNGRIPAVFEDGSRSIAYDGTLFTVVEGDAAVQYPYLLTMKITGTDGKPRTAYVLSAKEEVSADAVRQAAEKDAQSGDICILSIE